MWIAYFKIADSKYFRLNVLWAFESVSFFNWQFDPSPIKSLLCWIVYTLLPFVKICFTDAQSIVSLFLGTLKKFHIKIDLIFKLLQRECMSVTCAKKYPENNLDLSVVLLEQWYLSAITSSVAAIPISFDYLKNSQPCNLNISNKIEFSITCFFIFYWLPLSLPSLENL